MKAATAGRSRSSRCGNLKKHFPDPQGISAARRRTRPRRRRRQLPYRRRARRWRSSAKAAAARRRRRAASCARSSRQPGASVSTSARARASTLRTLPQGRLKAARRAYADDLPGPVLLAQSADDAVRSRRRAAAQLRHASRTEREARVAELLRRVGLRPEYMRRFPHAFQRRPAAAHRHCARAGAQPAPDRRRRGRSRRSTFRCRRRCSTCSPISAISSGSPISSSPMTSAS